MLTGGTEDPKPKVVRKWGAPMVQVPGWYKDLLMDSFRRRGQMFGAQIPWSTQTSKPWPQSKILTDITAGKHN